ncbi:MAG: recombinase family protein [Candidatus Saccharimonadales bacterium]
MNNDNLRYVAYLRKSSEAKERQALSIPAQKRAIQEKFPHLRIVDWIDEERSAFKAYNRPKFDDVLGRLEKGDIDGLVAWQPSRLSRNPLDAGRIVYLITTGVLKDLKFANSVFENNPDGIKNLQYSLADSQHFSAELSVNVKKGNREKRERGWLQTANLAGYMNKPNVDFPDDATENITAKDPERFDLIRKAWDLLLTGEYSVPAILDILNKDWGYLTRKTRKRGGMPLSRTGLYYIFNNVKYTGKIPNPINGELMQGSYPAMITVGEYNRGQYLLGKHGKPRLTERRDFPLKGIAICGECGCNITAEHKTRTKYNKTYVYYHCTHKKKSSNCKQPSIEEAEYNRQIEEFFAGHMIRKEFEEWGMEAIVAMNTEEMGDRQIVIENREKALNTVESKANRLLNLVANGAITEEQFVKMSQEAETEIKRLRKELDKILDNGSNWREAMRKTIDVLFNGRERFENGDIFAKREVLQSLGSNIVLKDKKIQIDTYKWLKPIQKEYKNLETKLDKVRTNDLQIEKGSIEPIRTAWRKGEDSNLR